MVQYSLRIVLFLCLVATTARAQQPEWRSKTDSLSQIAIHATTDKAKLDALHQLSSTFPPEEYHQSIEYTEQALSIAMLSDDTHEIVRSLTNLGAIYRNHNDYRRAISYFKRAIKSAPADKPFVAPTYLELGVTYLKVSMPDSSKLALETGLKLNEKRRDKRLEGEFYNMLGSVAKLQHDYESAISNYAKATDIFDLVNDKTGMTESARNTGEIHFSLGNYGLAMEYAEESLKSASDSRDALSIAYSHELMARIFRMQRRLDDALASYTKAIAIFKSLGATRDGGESHYNAGNIWFEKGSFEKAMSEYKAALINQRVLPDTRGDMAYSYCALGKALYELKNYTQSLWFLDSARVVAESHGLPYVMLDVHNYRSRVFASRDQYEEAYAVMTLFSSLQDSLAAEENRVVSRAVEARDQSEKNAVETRLMAATNQIAALALEKERSQRNYLISLAILSLVLIAVLYSRYSIKIKTNKKLRELDQLKARFFSNLSNEFKTPLSLITGPLEKKLTEANTVGEREEFEMMSRNAHRLTILINQLLDLSKLESRSMQLQVKEENIEQVLRLIGASFSSYADHKGIRLKMEIEPYTGPTYFDAEKLEKVLYNLLSNAIKFTPVKGTVYFRASVVNQHAVIFVKDTGIGIPQDKLPFIFKRFYQVDDVNMKFQEGSGIGLALCRELTELHRGTLTVESELNEGSEFVFTIPISRSAYRKNEVIKVDKKLIKITETTQVKDRALRSSGELPEDGLPLILIAEEDDDMRLYISNTLKLNYQVIGVSDGQTAFDKALDIVPDLVVTDVMLPRMDGSTFCDKLKSSAQTSHIPVVMLLAEKHDTNNKLTADDYLLKPFDARELLMRVHSLIQQRKKLQESFRGHVIVELNQLDLTDSDQRFLTSFSETLEGNYTNPNFGVEQLTEYSNMSRMQLHRKLKALTNKTPGDFLRQFRLERAKQFMTEGFSVSEAAFKTGFSHQSTFAKAFKDFTGSSPTDFGERQRA